MESVLKVTFRQDNLYAYDMNVDCRSCQVINCSDQFDLSSNDAVKRIALHPNRQKGCYLKGGYSAEILIELSTQLGLRFELVPDVGAYDFHNATEKDVDLFVGSYVLKEARTKFVDPTYITGFSRLKAFLNHEYDTSTGDSLFGPFNFSLWLMVLGSMIISLSIIWAMYNCNEKLTSTTRSCSYDILFDAFSVIFQKGSKTLMSGCDSLRIAGCVISMCFFIFLVHYSGWVYAFLSVQKYSVKTLPSLVASKYDIFIDKGYGNGSSSEGILQKIRREDPAVDKFLKKASKSRLRFDNFEDAIKKVRDGPVALITEDDSGIAAIKSALGGGIPCTWGQISIKRIGYPWSMYMKQNSPYRYRINSILLKMDERGIMKRIRKRWIPTLSSQECHKGLIEVNLVDVLSGFSFILIGFIIGIFSIIIEYNYGTSTLKGQKSK